MLRFALTLNRRLILLTALPMLGLLGIGGTFLQRLHSESRQFEEDLATLHDFRDTTARLNAFYLQLDTERSLALRVALTAEGPSLLSEYKKRIAETDRAFAALDTSIAQTAASFPALLPADRVAYIREPFQTLIPEARTQAAARQISAVKIMAAYARSLFNALILIETHRARLHTPEVISLYDGLYTANKMREIEAMIASLTHPAAGGYALHREDLGIVRKQYFALTESETYLRRYFPELRTAFDGVLKFDPASVAYYKYLADIAGSMIEGTLPPFPGATPLSEYMETRRVAYLACLDGGFTLALERLAATATEKRRNFHLLSAAIAALVLLSLAVNVKVTRSTQSRLAAVSRTIGTTAGDVRSAADQFTGASSQLSENASHNAASLEEISAALSQITAVSQNNDAHIGQASALAQQANQSVTTGVGTVGQLGTAMNAIRASSDKITHIIARINEISFQTNILALNAAVEAARAGAAGAGFSVVADEVRSLARHCADAAAETATLIEESTRNTALAISKSDEVTSVFGDLSHQVRQVGTLVTSISANFHQQAGGIAHVNNAIAQQETVAQSNAAIAEETAASALALKDQIRHLTESVGAMNTLLGLRTASSDSPSSPAASHPPQKPRTSPQPPLVIAKAISSKR